VQRKTGVITTEYTEGHGGMQDAEREREREMKELVLALCGFLDAANDSSSALAFLHLPAF